MDTQRTRFALGLLAALAIAVPAVAADYQTELRPMPVDDETKAFIGGQGQARASFEGGVLTVTGTFDGLLSDATQAMLMESPHIAVPGKKSADLTVTRATGGQVSGTLRLNRAQAAALRTGRLYIQINAEKAPPGYHWGPRGSVWGWLLPAHETAAPGVPQQGGWFLPQLDTPKR